MATELFSVWGFQSGWRSGAGCEYKVDAELDGLVICYRGTSIELVDQAFQRACRRTFVRRLFPWITSPHAHQYLAAPPRRGLRRQKLAPPPTGLEEVDLQWTSLMPWADILVANLLDGADPAAASIGALVAYNNALLAREFAETELERTPAGSVLVTLRRQRLHTCELACDEQAGNLLAGLVVLLQQDYPAASSGQLLILVRDAVKDLVSVAMRCGAFALEGEHA